MRRIKCAGPIAVGVSALMLSGHAMAIGVTVVNGPHASVLKGAKKTDFASDFAEDARGIQGRHGKKQGRPEWLAFDGDEAAIKPAKIRIRQVEPKECGQACKEIASIVSSITPPSSAGLSIPAVSPVPEPESYAMILTGLGMVAYMARRRARSAS